MGLRFAQSSLYQMERIGHKDYAPELIQALQAADNLEYIKTFCRSMPN